MLGMQNIAGVVMEAFYPHHRAGSSGRIIAVVPTVPHGMIGMQRQDVPDCRTRRARAFPSTRAWKPSRSCLA
jgi:hypothetical protein